MTDALTPWSAVAIIAIAAAWSVALVWLVIKGERHDD